MLNRPEISDGFPASVFKGNIRGEGHRVHDQPLDFSDWLVVR